nr:PorT family protein [Prevotella sp.]
MRHQMIHNIHDRLSSYEKKAPDGLLDDIKAEMARRGVSPVAQKKKTTIYPLLLKCASAVIAILLVSVALWNNNTLDENSIQKANKKIAEGIDNSDAVQGNGVDKQDDSGLHNGSTISKIISLIKHNTGDNVSVSSQNEMLAMTDNNINRSDTVTIAQRQQTDENTNSASGQKNAVLPPLPYKYSSSSDRNSNRVVASKKHKSTVTVGTYYAGMVNSMNMDNKEYPYSDVDCQFSSTIDATDGRFVYDRLPTDENVKEEHHQPVKVGVSVKFDLPQNWFIQSGLTYSYVTSDFYGGKYFNSAVYTSYKSKQRLHYIGVPVSIGYNIWHNKTVGIYMSAGGEVEKLVKGSVSSSTEGENNTSGNLPNGNITEKRLQFMLNAGAGIEYNLSDWMSVYAEPGACYYINNGSEVRNIYKDKKWNYNISVGLRMNLK